VRFYWWEEGWKKVAEEEKGKSRASCHREYNSGERDV